MGQVGSGNTATELTKASNEFAVGFTDGSVDSNHPMEECGSLSGRFNGVSIEDLVVLEICAGSERLTKAARAKGFKGIAVDHSSERSCGVDMCEFELADPRTTG